MWQRARPGREQRAITEVQSPVGEVQSLKARLVASQDNILTALSYEQLLSD